MLLFFDFIMCINFWTFLCTKNFWLYVLCSSICMNCWTFFSTKCFCKNFALVCRHNFLDLGLFLPILDFDFTSFCSFDSIGFYSLILLFSIDSCQSFLYLLLVLILFISHAVVYYLFFCLFVFCYKGSGLCFFISTLPDKSNLY